MNNMKQEIENKVVIVTGAAQGIGFSIADKFLQNEAKLVIILDVAEEKGNKAVNYLNTKYGENRSVFIKCDLVKDLEKVSSDIIRDYETIDILINNAGCCRENSIKDTMALNAVSVIEWSMRFFEHMRFDEGGKGGTIVNVSSKLGFLCDPIAPFYTASKHAVLGFTKSKGHAKIFANSGVRMVTICPGLTRTGILQDLFLKDYEEAIKKVPCQEPDAVGEAAVEVFENAESGTVWIIEAGKPLHQLLP